MAAAVSLGAEAAEFTVLDSTFTVSWADSNGVVYEEPSRAVPLIAGVCYGWRIRLAGNDRMIKATETFELPAAADVWSYDNNPYQPGHLSADRRTSVMPLFYTLEDGWFGHSWCVAAGDPVGPHTITVDIDGQEVARFDFEVVAPTVD